jgi:hypothetical protein
MICERCAAADELTKVVSEFNEKAAPLGVLSIGGQWRFSIYGATGGLTYDSVLYVERKNGKALAVLPVRLPAEPCSALLRRALDTAAESFDTHSHIVSEGGELGLVGLDFRKAFNG